MRSGGKMKPAERTMKSSTRFMNDKTKSRPECYGGMFPDFEHLHYNKPTDGKAFRVFVENIGVGTQRRDLAVKSEAWEQCVTCADFHPCYYLSTAKLSLHQALAQC